MYADKLSGPMIPAASGKATNAVVFLHGFGANGDDLISLGELLAPIFPDTIFFAPNGASITPFGMGYQWFSDNEFTFIDRPGIGIAAELLEDFLEQEVLGEYGIPTERTVIVGFSQGTMLGLFAAPRMRKRPAGMVAFSGAIMWQDELLSDNYHTFPVLIAHNKDDDVVNYQASEETHEQLQTLGFDDLDIILTERGGHGISEEGLKGMISFMQKVLPPIQK